MRLSVIIPVYNVEKYIARALDSILSQEQPAYEVILIDDGSSDDSVEVARALLTHTKATRFSIVSQINSGVSAARNVGLWMATGDYVVFLDGDDYVSPELVARLEHAIRDGAADILSWGFDTVDAERRANRRYFDVFPIRNAALTGSQALKEITLEGRLAIWTGSAAYRRSFLLENGLNFTEGCASGEDREFIYKALAHAQEVRFVNRVLSFYVDREGSITNSYSVRKFESLNAHRRASDYLISRPEWGLDRVAEAIVYQNAVAGFFRHLNSALRHSGGDIDAVLEDIETQYPDLTTDARSLIWASIRHSRRLPLGRLMFLLWPRAFAWVLTHRGSRREGAGRA